MFKNTDDTYGSVTKFFHWTVALSILFLCVLGIYMERLPIGSADEVEQKFWLYSLHKTAGLLTFFVAVLRIFWAFLQSKPKSFEGAKPVEHWLAQTVHWLLYGSLIVMPLSGWLHHAATRGFAPIWLGLPQGFSLIPENKGFADYFSWVHFLAGIILIVSIGLHCLGAFKHYVIDKDQTLQRMLPFGGSMKDAVLVLDEKPSRSSFWMAMVLFALAVGASTGFYMQKQSGANTAESPPLTETAMKTNWKVDYANSTLGVIILQSGEPTKGKFGNWSSAIIFDPDDLANANVETIVDIASLELGGVTDQAKSADFLDTLKHPKGHFISSNFEALADGSYIAHGTLALAGIVQPFDLPFRLQINGDEAVMVASSTINRIDFGIGKAGFNNEDSVSFEVTIEINLTANKTKP